MKLRFTTHLLLLAIILLALILLPACAAPGARTDGLISGPMLGDLRPHSVRLWVAAKAPGVYSIELAREDALHTWEPALDAVGHLVELQMDGRRLYAQCQLTGLQPETAYRYRLVKNKVVLPSLHPQRFRTPAADGKAFSFRVAFGSCAGNWGIDPSQPIFRAIENMHPDAFLWLGDNVYYASKGKEWNDPAAMEARWELQRAMPNLQGLLASCAQYAIWDDHDYGPNDSDGTYPLRDFSLDLFTSYWPNPSAGLDGPDGVFFAFKIGRVEFFMLDTRYARSPNHDAFTRNKVLLSSVQWDWLEQGLKNSTADFKVIASGMQVLSTYHRFETWNLFPSERARLLDFLSAEAIPGVLMISGDRHIGEALRLEREGTYPLVEFTSSPLAAGIGEAEPDSQVAERIPGTLAVAENFGILDFRFQGSHPELSFRLYDVYGEPLGREVVLRFDELQP
ncbi:MAG: alkaline phosphatase D family protein [Planctomycetota bacterium]